MAWLRLIRWKNLLIVLLTQLLVWYCLIFNNSGQDWREALDATGCIVSFTLISLSTILIAAAGYIINDYFDIKIDIINRPGKVVLEKTINLRHAIIAHTIFNVLALICSGYVAYCSHHIEWVFIQVICTVLLWFYSTHFKKQFIIGNLVVALLTALTILVLVVYRPALNEHFFTGKSLAGNEPSITNWIVAPLHMCYGYAFFAFMLTWMREIVKDMEDFKGDAEQGCVTMPIKMGLQFSERFTNIIGAVTIAVLLVISGYFIAVSYILLGVYILICIAIPLVAWSFYFQKENSASHYHMASRWLKIIMLSGISTLIIYHFKIVHIS